MDKKVLDYVVEKTNELINAATCNAETKASAEAWLAAVGTDQEAEATKKYIAVSLSQKQGLKYSAGRRPLPEWQPMQRRSKRKELHTATARRVLL